MSLVQPNTTLGCTVSFIIMEIISSFTKYYSKLHHSTLLNSNSKQSVLIWIHLACFYLIAFSLFDINNYLWYCIHLSLTTKDSTCINPTPYLQEITTVSTPFRITDLNIIFYRVLKITI